MYSKQYKSLGTKKFLDRYAFDIIHKYGPLNIHELNKLLDAKGSNVSDYFWRQEREGKLSDLSLTRVKNGGRYLIKTVSKKNKKVQNMSKDRESIKVLQECAEMQLKKSQDYQNPNSNVKQAMHYRRGVDSIHDTMHGKMLRAQSLLESGETANFESLEDTYKDLINYASFAVAYIRGKMEGQDPNLDFLNRPKTTGTNND